MPYKSLRSTLLPSVSQASEEGVYREHRHLRTIHMRQTRFIVGTLLLGTALLIAFGCSDPATVTVDGDEVQKGSSKGPKGSAEVVFSPDSKKLVIACSRRNSDAFLFDLGTRKRVTLYHDIDSGCGAVAFSPNGKWIALGCGNGTVRLWDVAAAREVAILEGDESGLYSVTFSPDSSLLASAEHAGQVRIWDVKTKKEKYVLPRQSDHVISVEFTPDGSALIYAVDSGEVGWWDLARDKKRTLVEGIEGLSAVVRSMRSFPDGKSFLLVTSAIGIHRVETGERTVSFATKSGRAHTGVVCPGGDFVLFGCGNVRLKTPEPGYVEVWKADGTYLTRFRAHDYPVASIAVSPDGRKLATGDHRGSAKLWNLSSILAKDGK